MSALRLSSPPTGEALGELRAAIGVAYEQVQIARRCLAQVAPTHEVTAFLQSAEADLVRAMVAAGRIETKPAGPFGALPSDGPVPITKHSSLTRTA